MITRRRPQPASPKKFPPFLLTNIIAAIAILTRPCTSYESKSKCPLKPPSSVNRPPIVIGHRGASFNIPEHTLAGYRLALELGADFIEPDLVPTKDGHLVAVHSIDLSITTDVSLKFPDRHRTHPTKNETGYFVQDFTLVEIKQLLVKQRVRDTPARSRYLDWKFQIPTLPEILELLGEWNANALPSITNSKFKTAGLYLELKEPGLLKEDADIDVANLLLNLLKNDVYSDRLFRNETCASLKIHEYVVPPLVIQCFDPETLHGLREGFRSDEARFHGVVPPIVLLVSLKRCTQEEFWFEVGKLEPEGVGPDKGCVLNKEDGKEFMTNAMEHNVAVHPWTERLELDSLDDRFDSADDELMYLFCEVGVHGIFTENVDVGRRVADRGCPLVTTPDQGGGLSRYGLCSSQNRISLWLVGGLSGLMGLLLGGMLVFLSRSSCFLESADKDEKENTSAGFSSIDVAPSDIGHGQTSIFGAGDDSEII